MLLAEVIEQVFACYAEFGFHRCGTIVQASVDYLEIRREFSLKILNKEKENPGRSERTN